jgi:hypothetical protein
MKRAYVVVKGPSDADFLRKVLTAQEQEEVEFVPAGNGFRSLARSLLVRRRVPLLVFMDSDSLNPDLIEERRGSTEEFIKYAAGSVPVKVVVAVPEVESCFFAAPEVIERVLGEKVPANLVRLGERDPKGVLGEYALAGNHKWDMQQAIMAMEPKDIERIRALPAIQEVTEFLQNLTLTGSAGSQKGRP